MQTQALTITGTKGPRTLDAALQALKTVSGVAEALSSPRPGVVTIRFDQERTSLQELRAILTAAGYDTLPSNAPAVNEGSCCGSCGG